MADNPPTNNPLVGIVDFPPFEAIEPSHVEPGIRALLESLEADTRALEESAPSDWSLVEKLADLSEPLGNGWGAVNHLMGVKNSEELREAHSAVEQDVVSTWMALAQNRTFYDGVKALKEGDYWDGFNGTQQRIIDRMLQDAELAGIALADEERERFNEIERELADIRTQFSNNVMDARKAWTMTLETKDDVTGLPDLNLAMAAQAAERAGHEGATPDEGPWVITMDIPSFLPFMKHAKNRDHREKLYRAYLQVGATGEWNNTPNIDRILELRHEKAKILGFNTHAEVSLAQKMAPDVEAVESQMDGVWKAAHPAALKDMEEMRELAATGIDGVLSDGTLEHWDLHFISERLRETKYDITDEELRPYFPLEKVLEGLFLLVNRLFGIQVEAADGDAPVWNDDVRYFKVKNEVGDPIAGFYLDPYSRPENKRGGAWMNVCIHRREIPGKSPRLPVAYLVCNQTPPVGETPSLMTFGEVRTLFHEFGHGLQHMLTTVGYYQAAGINGVEWDAVEICSQFMENWLYQKDVVDELSGHYQTGEPLPDELFERVVRAKNFQTGRRYIRQICFGRTDLELYHRYTSDSTETPLDVYRRIANESLDMPIHEDDQFLCHFSHIFPGGYSAGYYSYLWSEVLSADCFAAFEDAGLNDPEAVKATGRKYRDTFLSLGGGLHPMEVFKAFRQRDPSTEAFLRHNGLT